MIERGIEIKRQMKRERKRKGGIEMRQRKREREREIGELKCDKGRDVERMAKLIEEEK